MEVPGSGRLPTLRDVATAAEVALSTASRALNGDPTVSAHLAERVLVTARRLGYVPNFAARALRTRGQLVTLLAADIGTEAIGQIAAGMDAVAREEGALTTVSSAGGDPAAQLAALVALRATRPRAVVLTGAWLTDPSIQQPLSQELEAFVGEDGGRVVVVGLPMEPYSSVGFDDYGAGLLMAAHMARSSAGPALILAGPRWHHAFRDRASGFVDGLERAGIGDIRVVHSPVTRDDAEAATRTALASRTPRLVLGGNDRLALGALRALSARGLAVPDDVAVSGVDDIRISRDASPPLTSIALPFFEAGQSAMREALAGTDRTAARVVLAGRLVARDSSVIPSH